MKVKILVENLNCSIVLQISTCRCMYLQVSSLQSELDRLRSFNFSESDEVTRLKGELAAAESRLSEQQREADSRVEQLTQEKQVG